MEWLHRLRDGAIATTFQIFRADISPCMSELLLHITVSSNKQYRSSGSGVPHSLERTGKPKNFVWLGALLGWWRAGWVWHTSPAGSLLVCWWPLGLREEPFRHSWFRVQPYGCQLFSSPSNGPYKASTFEKEPFLAAPSEPCRRGPTSQHGRATTAAADSLVLGPLQSLLDHHHVGTAPKVQHVRPAAPAACNTHPEGQKAGWSDLQNPGLVTFGWRGLH
jgi:hypothetical protein